MGEDREWRGERQKTVKRGDDRREIERSWRGEKGRGKRMKMRHRREWREKD